MNSMTSHTRHVSRKPVPADEFTNIDYLPGVVLVTWLLQSKGKDVCLPGTTCQD